MNNDDLKKTITKIVAMAILEADELPFVETAEYVAERLIAAGIGDVKATEHRAEVAEMALYNACCEQNRHWCVNCEYFSECDTSSEICVEAKKHAKELLQEAEKELSEERKDEV